MYSVPGDTTSLAPGFPIRTSSDPRSVDSSPRHIAASHVLHRLPVPRHPPCALKHLQTQNQKFIKTFKIAHQHQRRTAAARCSQPLSTNQTPHPTTKARQQHAPIPQPGDDANPDSPHAGQRGDGPVVSKPNSVFSGSLTGVSPPDQRLSCTQTPPTTGGAHPSNRPTPGAPRDAGRAGSRGAP
jgi:hypothetical protein